MQLRCASFNVLADAYLGYGDYAHVPSRLLVARGRLHYTLLLIHSLRADVIGLQEVEPGLMTELEKTGEWQLFWTPKTSKAPDGCLLLVRSGIEVVDFKSHAYSDGLGHVMQLIVIGGTVFANTHIKWAPANDPHHVGAVQTQELIDHLGPSGPAVIFADCNDRPGGPVRALVEAVGFTNVHGSKPTALIGSEHAAIDLLAVRGLHATPAVLSGTDSIPSVMCPSDHVPVVALVEAV